MTILSPDVVSLEWTTAGYTKTLLRRNNWSVYLLHFSFSFLTHFLAGFHSLYPILCLHTPNVTYTSSASSPPSSCSCSSCSFVLLLLVLLVLVYLLHHLLLLLFLLFLLYPVVILLCFTFLQVSCSQRVSLALIFCFSFCLLIYSILCSSSDALIFTSFL